MQVQNYNIVHLKYVYQNNIWDAKKKAISVIEIPYMCINKFECIWTKKLQIKNTWDGFKILSNEKQWAKG